MRPWGILLIHLLLFSCNSGDEDKNRVSDKIKSAPAKGCIVPQDSVAEPIVAIWDESKAQKIKAGNPQVVLYRSNLVKAGRPKQKEFRNPIGLPEGMGGVTPPNITTARDTQILAGAPDIIIAKDMVSKDHNPGNFSTYGKLQGLKHDKIRCMLQDKRGNLWFGTRFGISLLREKKLKEIYNNTINNSISEQDICFKNFTYADGFLGIGVNIGKTLLEDNNGNIWIAANDRVMLYHHTARDIQEVNGPVIEINGLSLFNEKINWSLLEGQQDSTLILGNGMKMKNYRFSTVTPWDNIPEKLSLAYDNNYLSFHFTGVTLNQAQKVKYRYILEGNDNNWSALTARNEAAYGNLEPGRYRFRVKAMNSEGYWSQESSYDFEIRPPWWKTWWAYVSYVILSLLSLVLFIRRRERNLKQRQKELEIKVDEATSEIRHRKEEIEKEKHRSDELLLNILPEEVAEELKNKGEAEAKQIDEVTVLFTDFKGFTSLSEKLSPKELVHEIHECFSEFDKIMLRHGVEKIKTIGDAYMAAGGLPVPNKTHAQDVVNAALDIQAFMEMHKKERQTMGALFFEIRIGVHTGPVVAGIVGLKKFAYDIWGDTVNTASRMESSGEVGKVNISETTYVKVKDHFNCTPRGKINAKGKGEVDMYFISRR